MIINPPDETEQVQRNLPAMIGPGGYANPTMPIRVALARDEEAAGIESEATKIPPPAYGLWRESVVCVHVEILEQLLMFNRGLILIVYSGNETKQQL